MEEGTAAVVQPHVASDVTMGDLAMQELVMRITLTSCHGGERHISIKPAFYTLDIDSVVS